VESDPQCWAKLAIAKCLKEFGFAEAAPFVRGLHHFQWESTWGGKTDTAAGLRSTCALALVQCTDLPRHETLVHLVNAVTDPDANVRTDAVRALEQMGGREVILLLRLKARCADKEARVTGQVLEALLAVEGPAAVGFVTQFLHSVSEEECDEAALALGASRLNEAVEALKAAWLNPRGIRPIPVLLRAISASRLDSAIDFLLEQIRDGRLHTAEEVLKAMDLHRDSEEIVRRIGEAVSDREELKSLYSDLYHRRP
jgi:HEAT repeat protein